MKNGALNSRMTLLLGWGSELRGDDVAGRMVARQVATLNRPDVEAIDIHQLTPEWAARLADYDRVVFVDARQNAPGTDGVPTLTRLDTSRDAAVPHSVHRVSPEYLLALAARLYGACPEAWLLSLPVVCFDLGAPLSAQAAAGIAAAVAQCGRLLEHTVSVQTDWISRERKAS